MIRGTGGLGRLAVLARGLICVHAPEPGSFAVLFYRDSLCTQANRQV